MFDKIQFFRRRGSWPTATLDFEIFILRIGKYQNHDVFVFFVGDVSFLLSSDGRTIVY